MNLKLVEPTVELEHEHQTMLHEWLQTGERLVPFSLQYDTSDFTAYISKLYNLKKGIDLPKGFVACSTFWMVNSDDRILGTVDIRHALVPHLYIEGGHIGYGIRPSERGKGYATELLSLALPEAKSLEIDKVLLTCDDNNPASEKTILNNRGRFFQNNKVNGKVKLSFWIDL